MAGSTGPGVAEQAALEEQAAPGEQTELKSAYQVARELNIRRNLAELAALGIDVTAPGRRRESGEKQLHQQAASDDDDDDDDDDSKKGASSTRKRKPRTPREGERKSRRLRCLNPDDTPLLRELEPAPELEEGAEQDERDATMERKLQRLRELHLENGTAYKNPTATYEHTWMRVRTMSDKALAGRVRAIERACGQHCIVKMRMFAEVLILADKQDLASQASAALERLQAQIQAPSSKQVERIISC